MKKSIFLLIVMAVITLAVTACGKESDIEASTPVGNVVDIEDIVEEIPMEDVTDADGTNDNSEPEQAGTFDTENDVENANQQTVETKTEPSKEQQLVEKPQELAEQVVPTATLNGKITSVGNGEFVIQKANVISSDVMVSDGERAETVSVTYTENTEFELCTSSDGGITADYSAASSLDLVSDNLVEIKGAYEGNSFVAQKVTIYSFNE